MPSGIIRNNVIFRLPARVAVKHMLSREPHQTQHYCEEANVILQDMERIILNACKGGFPLP